MHSMLSMLTLSIQSIVIHLILCMLTLSTQGASISNAFSAIYVEAVNTFSIQYTHI